MSDKPKFSFEISEEQARRALRCFPYYGQRRAVMSVILDELMDMVEKHGQIVFGLILEGDVGINQCIPSLCKVERTVKKIGKS